MEILDLPYFINEESDRDDHRVIGQELWYFNPLSKCGEV